MKRTTAGLTDSGFVSKRTDVLTFSSGLPGNLTKDIHSFLLDREVKGCSARTIQYYRDELFWWAQFLVVQGVTDMENVTPSHVRLFLQQMGETRNAGGVHAVYRAMRAFSSWWGREYDQVGWSDPVHKVKLSKPKLDPLEPVSLDHVKALIASCDIGKGKGARDKAILLTLLDTGCRAAEFCALNVGDLDFRTGAVTIRQGKGGKFRVVFIGLATRKAVNRYLRTRPGVEQLSPLWITSQGTRLRYSGLCTLMRRRAAAANVPVPSLHSFRRAFALLSLREGMDVYSLQKLMGHSDLTVLRRYLAQTEGDLQAAHQKAGPVDRLL